MKKKIRFHINSLSGGGAEKVLVDLLNQLDPNRYEITLVTNLGGVHEKRVPKYVKYHKIIHCGNPRLQTLLSKVINKLPPSVYAKLFLRGQYDLEIAYLEGRTTQQVAAKKTAVPKIAFVHCDLSVKNLIAPLYKSTEDCLCAYKDFSHVCFVSEASKQGFEKAVGVLENSRVIHNVIDFEGIHEKSNMPPTLKYETSGWKLVTVGRLAEEKGFDRLLRIVSELEKEHALELWIIGEGKERNKLEALIRDRSIKSVKLLGYQENPYPLLKQADLFICSSLFEGYSTAVSEAVALGIPVLTTSCAGMDEILERGKNGLIVENSEIALKTALKLFLEKKTVYHKEFNCKGQNNTFVNDSARNEYDHLFSSIPKY